MYEYTDLENYTNNTTNLKSWVDVYNIFIDISNIILNTNINHDIAHSIINSWVGSIYIKHIGEPIWDIAYERWSEPTE